MKKSIAYLAYRHLDNDKIINTDIVANYKLIILFNEHGELDFKELEKTQVNMTEENEIYFKTKEEILIFAEKLQTELQFAGVYLLSSKDFNIGIESCHDVNTLKEIFTRYGEFLSLEGSESNSGRGFGKFFRKT